MAFECGDNTGYQDRKSKVTIAAEGSRREPIASNFINQIMNQTLDNELVISYLNHATASITEYKDQEAMFVRSLLNDLALHVKIND